MKFVDTNVLLYAVASGPGEDVKAVRAEAILEQDDLALSVQVLQEFYVQATRRQRASPLSHDEAVAFLRTLERFPIQENTLLLLHSGLAAAARWQISFWDACVIEAARALGCNIVYSEDLQHLQDFDGVQVLNPFL